MVKPREYGQAVAIFALMIIVFFYPLLYGRVLSQADVVYIYPPWSSVKPQDFSAPSNSVLSDQTLEFLSFFKVARESLSRHEVPLWNPYIMGGTPLLANSQSALLFPLNWPFYFLPFYLGFTVSAVLKMLIASLATYAFARKISLSHAAAIAAGTVYTFSIFNVFWLNHPHTNVMIFFPLLLLIAERIKTAPSWSSVGVLGLAVGIQLLGGHVEIAFLIAVAVTLFFLFRLIEFRKDTHALLPRLKIYVEGYLLGFFLAGLLMIPFLEFLFHSATWQVRSGSNPFSLGPLSLMTMVLPNFFIGPKWPVPSFAYHALSLYAGIGPLILSIIALFHPRQRVTLFFAGLALFTLLTVFRVPPFFSLLASLPLFKQTPLYYMVLFHILSISLLSGIGLDVVLNPNKDPVLRERIKKTLIGASFILPLLVAGLILLVMETPFLSSLLKGVEGLSVPAIGEILYEVGNNCVRSSFFVGLTFALVALALLTRWPRGLFGFFAAAIIFVDLFLAGSGWNPAIPVEWAEIPLPPSAQFLQQDKEVYRIAGIGPVMAPNLATYCSLQDIRGYDVPVMDRYHTFFHQALKGKGAWWYYDLPKLADGSLDFLSLVNVKYILSNEPLPPPLKLVYDKEIKIYENPDVFPRCFLVHQAEAVEGGKAALEHMMALGPDLRRVVVIEGEESPPKVSATPSISSEKSAEGRIQIVEYTARQVKIDAETSSSGFLVLGDTYFPGWKAYVDGKRVPLYRADYLLKAIEVEKGSHRIVFSYQPLSFRIGLGLTLISGVLILWLFRKRQ